MAPRTDLNIYCFDAFRLDPARGVVLDADGAELRLRPKAFALLLHLLDNPGRLLGREELLDALWPGIAVTDDSLTQCIGDLRHAFGARAAHVLRTVPKRGYTLTAPVRRDEQPEPSPQAAPQPPPASDVAALRDDPVEICPIEAPDGERACVQLAETLTIDVLAIASRIEGIRVRRATAGTAATSYRVAGAAATGYRVAGEVRAAGPGLRISFRLEEAATGDVLWADRLEHPNDGSSGVSEATLLTFAAHLNRQVARHSLLLARRKPLAERSARELCLIGRDHYRRVTADDTQVAREMFARAIAADPEYGQAYAWQAYTVQRAVTHGWGGPGGQDARDEALRLARKAVQLQPESTLCLSRLAFALVLDQRWDEAVDAARAALASARPAFAFTRITCCEVLTAAGHPEEAVRVARETILLEPVCPPLVQGILGRALLLAGQAEDALPPLRWCASQLPDYAATYDTLVIALMETGRLPEALAARRDLLRIRPDWTPRNHTAFWYFRRPEDLHRFQAAHRWAEELAGAATEQRAASATEPPNAQVDASDPLVASADRPAPAPDLAILRQDTLVLFPLQADSDEAAARAASAMGSGLMDELVRYIDLRVVTDRDQGLVKGFEVRGDVHVVGEHLSAHLRLADGATGTTFWSQRLECLPGHAPGFSARSIAALAAAIDVQVARRSLHRARQKPPERLTAREMSLLGRERYYRSTEADTAAARQMFIRAAALDPGYAHAHAWQTFAAARIALHGWGGPGFRDTVEQAVSFARNAVDLEPEAPLALAALSLALALQDQWTEAIASARLALGARYLAGDGTRIAACDVLAAAGHADEAEIALRQAMARDPHCSPVLHAVLGRALLLKGSPEDAMGELRLCAARLPEYALCFRTMVVAAIEAGMIEEARAALREVARLRPDWISGSQPIFWFLRRPDDIARYERAFRMAVHLDATAQAGGLMQAPASCA